MKSQGQGFDPLDFGGLSQAGRSSTAICPDKPTSPQLHAPEPSGNDNHHIVEILPFDCGKDGAACCSGGFSVIAGTISLACPKSPAIMSRVRDSNLSKERQCCGFICNRGRARKESAALDHTFMFSQAIESPRHGFHCAP